MKITKVIIENFRCYKGHHEITISDLNVFIGKNDIGKSSIFEALDIILDGGIIKFDKDDICKYKNTEDEIILGIEFSSIPENIIIDSTAETSLKDELLLYDDDKLIFLLKGKNSATLKPFIRTKFAKHTKYKKILDKNIDELKSIADELTIDKNEIPYDERIKSSIRKAIREHISKKEKNGLVLIEQDVAIEKEDGKSIYEQIKKYFPSFALFQSDRKNEDQDKEAQDPMKAATKEILNTLKNELDKVQEDVIKYVETVAEKTLEKLREMNPELADNLIPEFSKNPDWSSVFKYSLKTKDEIPLNKRGSGVRRMILLNFFRARAEKNVNDLLLQNDKIMNHIVYAFEEPETAQHPNHQKMLIESFIEMSRQDNIQLFFTTHSPEIAKLINPSNINLIKRQEDNILIQKGDESLFREIADELGVLPSILLKNIERVKCIICVEGHNDIEFLHNINQNISELKEIIDLSNNSVIILPMGGSTLQFWVNYDYLAKLNLPQVHIYDSDIGSNQENKYKEFVDKINSKENSIAFETKKREMENYIHPDLINSKFDQSLAYNTNWDTLDVTKEIKKDVNIRLREGKVKEALNNELSKNMTKAKFEEIDAWEEIKEWFEKIKQLSQI